MLLVNLPSPDSSKIFFAALLKIVALDLVDLDDSFDEWLNLIETKPISENFSMMGYESLYVIRNFGSLIFIFPIGMFILFIGWLLKFTKRKAAVKIHLAILKFFIFGGTIAFFSESFLLMTVSLMTNTLNFKFSDFGSLVNSLVTIVFAIFATGYLVFASTFFFNKIVKINKHKFEFKRKFSMLYNDLNVKRNGKLAFVHQLMSTWRKLILCVVVVYMQSLPVFSIFVLNFLSVAMLIATGLIRPYKVKKLNTIDMVNEATALMVIYHLFCFSDFVLDGPARNTMGTSMVLLTVLSLVFNLGGMAYCSLRDSCRRAQLKYIKNQKIKAHKKAIVDFENMKIEIRA